MIKPFNARIKLKGKPIGEHNLVITMDFEVNRTDAFCANRECNRSMEPFELCWKVTFTRGKTAYNHYFHLGCIGTFLWWIVRVKNSVKYEKYMRWGNTPWNKI